MVRRSWAPTSGPTWAMGASSPSTAHPLAKLGERPVERIPRRRVVRVAPGPRERRHPSVAERALAVQPASVGRSPFEDSRRSVLECPAPSAAQTRPGSVRSTSGAAATERASRASAVQTCGSPRSCSRGSMCPTRDGAGPLGDRLPFVEFRNAPGVSQAGPMPSDMGGNADKWARGAPAGDQDDPPASRCRSAPPRRTT